MKTAAIVLAAGKSERMGKNKLLLKLGGTTLINSILDALEASGIGEIIVVLGHEPQEIMNEIKHKLNSVRVAINERYEEGMTSSFKKGLKQIQGADVALLVLGDEPILDHKFLRVMVERMEKARGDALIISPIHKGKKGHPLLFSKQLFDEILNLKEREVIRDVVHRHTDKLVTVDAPVWTILDIDTPEDFEKIQNLLADR